MRLATSGRPFRFQETDDRIGVAGAAEKADGKDPSSTWGCSNVVSRSRSTTGLRIFMAFS